MSKNEGKSGLESEGGKYPWEMFARRLATLRVVGGLPAVRLELTKYPKNILLKLLDLALEASVVTGLDEAARISAIEVAAMVLDAQNEIDKENKDG